MITSQFSNIAHINIHEFMQVAKLYVCVCTKKIRCVLNSCVCL